MDGTQSSSGIVVVHLDGEMVEVQLEILGSVRTIRGKGSYDHNDPDLGPVLRICVRDPYGDFEILLPESTYLSNPDDSPRSGFDCRNSQPKSTVQ